MLLTGYTKQIFRPECNAQFESLHCIARLNEDVSAALPFLNSELGGTQYLNDPPEVMFHHHGRIIKVSATEIAINALKDEQEADRVLTWLLNQINQAWQRREEITPCYEGQKRPQLINILKSLPRTNCQKCGQPTCMVFAAQVVAGGRNVDACPELSEDNREKLEAYLAGFVFD